MRNWFSRFSKKPKPSAPNEEAAAKSAVPAGVPTRIPIVNRVLRTVGLITVGILIGVGALNFVPSLIPTEIALSTSTLEPIRTPLPTVTKAPTQTIIPQPTPTYAPPVISVETAVKVEPLLIIDAGCGGPVSSLALAPDNVTLAIGCQDGNIHLTHPYEDGFFLSIPTQGYLISNILFSQDGKFIVSSDAIGRLIAWNTSSGEKVYEKPSSGINLFNFEQSPDGKQFSAVCNDGSVRTFRMRDGELLHTLIQSQYGFNRTAYSSDSKLLAGASNDRFIYIWRVDNGMMLSGYEMESLPNAVALSPDGNSFAAGMNTTTPNIYIFNISETKMVAQLYGMSSGTITNLKFTPAGDLLIAVVSDNTIKMWDITQPQVLQTLEGHTAQITGLALSGDGRFIATSSDDGTIRIWGIP